MKHKHMLFLLAVFTLIATVCSASSLPVEHDEKEKYELQQVGMMMHGGENSGAYYQIITDNGVAGLVKDGTEIQGWLTFLRSGNTVSSSTSGTASSSEGVYAESNRGAEAFPEEVLQLVNKERAKIGARPLRLNDELMAGAKIRAEEITRHFSHDRPDGKSCFTVLRNRNRTLGENIAAGNATPEEVVDSWMHSPGHRANILNKDFKELGVGYYYKENSTYKHYWIQMFRG